MTDAHLELEKVPYPKTRQEFLKAASLHLKNSLADFKSLPSFVGPGKPKPEQLKNLKTVLDNMKARLNWIQKSPFLPQVPKVKQASRTIQKEAEAVKEIKSDVKAGLQKTPLPKTDPLCEVIKPEKKELKPTRVPEKVSKDQEWSFAKQKAKQEAKEKRIIDKMEWKSPKRLLAEAIVSFKHGDLIKPYLPGGKEREKFEKDIEEGAARRAYWRAGVTKIGKDIGYAVGKWLWTDIGETFKRNQLKRELDRQRKEAEEAKDLPVVDFVKSMQDEIAEVEAERALKR